MGGSFSAIRGRRYVPYRWLAILPVLIYPPGTLQPVQVTLPSIDEDEPDLVDPPPANAEPTGRKKRKGRDDDD